MRLLAQNTVLYYYETGRICAVVTGCTERGVMLTEYLPMLEKLIKETEESWRRL
jgi:hypothetical protein